MTIRRSLVQVIRSAVVTLAIGACAGPGDVHVEGSKASNTEAQSVTSGATVVFGKLNLVRDGEQPKIDRITILGRSGTAALVLPDNAGTALVLDMDQQGWFSWRLRPGAYSLLGFVSLDGNKTLFHDIGARFAVDNNEPAIYIGHINLESNASRYSAGIQDLESEAFEEMRKRSPGAASPVKRLLQRSDKIGTYEQVRSVCDPKWGLHCNRDGHGVMPIHPKLTRGIHGSTFGRIDTVAPILKWQPAAMGVSYDVAIWEAAAYRLPSKLVSDYTPGHVALYEENVAAPELTFAKPLKPKTKYFWSVRCRDENVISSWSRAGHFSFLLVAWSSGYGEWFAFETP
jgi:hypothetical protein